MAISSLQLNRVSNLLRTSVSNQNITRTQQLLMNVQNQLATGKRVNSPSDDPGAAAIIQQLNKTLERRQSYATNLKSAAIQLGHVDTQLDAMTRLLQQAKQIAMKDVGSDITADMRAADAEVISSIYSQMLSVANTELGGVYIFGGDAASSAPFKEIASGVKFTGSVRGLKNVFDEGITLPFMVNGGEVFGATSGRVQGTVDLTPAVDGATRIADLRGARNLGVALSSIRISDGSTTATVDLSAADTLDDVKTAIESAVPGMTVGYTGGGLTLSSSVTGSVISITESGEGTCAADLGLLKTAAVDTPLAGDALRARITPLTQLAQLNGGTFSDFSGLKITNGPSSATIAMAGADTVEAFMNRINAANLGVQASISDDGTRLNLINITQGSSMTIGENGGLSATQLGIRSFTPSDKLSDLNGGKGVQTNASGDLRLTDSQGNTYVVSLASAVTVQDVLDAINSTTGGQISASFATNGNGLVIQDMAGGTGILRVESLDFSPALRGLGLDGTVSGNVLTGRDVRGIPADGVFAHLQALRKAMLAGDQAGMSAAAEALQGDWSRVARIRGQMGARVQEIESRQNRLEDENVSTAALISSLQDTDFTDAITKFQNLQTTLQATLQASGRVLGLSLMDFLR